MISEVIEGIAITVLVVALLASGGWVYLTIERGKVRRAAEAAARTAARKERLWNQYQWALANMTTDPQARLNVVNFGREWYGFMRGGPVSMYDEVAIANDIKAAGG